MLIIPDIHIHHRHASQIIESILDFVKLYPDEQDVILLGDYVYMFSYDSRAIQMLYQMILDIRAM